jgi:N-sulfoglucosamine sulfohydrolase
MPYRPLGQHIEYLWQAPSVSSWEEAFKTGQCNEIQSRFWLPKPAEELYDSENDPWEVNNLAGDPAYAEVLNRMRNECLNWSTRILDTGFIPEEDRTARAAGQPFYDYFRQPGLPFREIVEAANLGSSASARDFDTLVAYLKNSDSAIRYWGATGLLILKEDARPAIPDLMEALNDELAQCGCGSSRSIVQSGGNRPCAGGSGENHNRIR